MFLTSYYFNFANFIEGLLLKIKSPTPHDPTENFRFAPFHTLESFFFFLILDKRYAGTVYIGITIGPVRKSLRLFSHRVCEWADNVRHFHTFFVVCFQKCNLDFERLHTSTFYKKHLKAH